jgi:hypothetical protein
MVDLANFTKTFAPCSQPSRLKSVPKNWEGRFKIGKIVLVAMCPEGPGRLAMAVPFPGATQSPPS